MSAPIGQLSFPDRKEKGRFAVLDGSGTPVAHLRTRWTGSFSATDAADLPLCAAAVVRRGWSWPWQATGPDGRPLLTLAKGWGASSATVTLARGGVFTVTGSGWKRDFSVRDSSGAEVVTAVPQTSNWSLHAYSYVVTQTVPDTGSGQRQQGEEAFDVAELVCIVQIWRTVKQQANAAAAS